jgi:glycosyltransferase involved in cell wall biosynthesis
MISSENKYLISVIVVTYNRLNYLKDTIDSILQQTYKNLEILIIGDGNQIDVKNYISELSDDRVKYLFVPHCGYPAKARNYGIKNSSGDFIAFCDDDDLWVPQKLEKQLNKMSELDNYGLCFTNRIIIDSNGKLRESNQNNIKWIPSKPKASTLLYSNYITYSSVLVNRTLLKTQEFPDTLKYRAVEDYHLWLRLSQISQLAFINEKLVLYRIHDANITNKLSVGAWLNFEMFNDLQKNYDLAYFSAFRGKLIAFLKFNIYKILELNNGKS